MEAVIERRRMGIDGRRGRLDSGTWVWSSLPILPFGETRYRPVTVALSASKYGEASHSMTLEIQVNSCV